MRYVVVNACFWLVAALFMFGSSATASDRFYIGLEAGFSKSGTLAFPFRASIT